MRDPGNGSCNNYAGETMDNASESGSSFSDAVEAGRDAAIDNSISESLNESWTTPSWFDGPSPKDE